MDLKGQYLCERTFLTIMWSVTLLSVVLTFVLDNVLVMFLTFASGLGISAMLCVPDWPFYNKSPLAFQLPSDASTSTSLKTD